jgi:hypothetical protein
MSLRTAEGFAKAVKQSFLTKTRLLHPWLKPQGFAMTIDKPEFLEH